MMKKGVLRSKKAAIAGMMTLALIAEMVFPFGQNVSSAEETTIPEVQTTETPKPQATKTPYMKKLNLKWDLKKNKTVKYKVAYAGTKIIKQEKAKITNYKISKAKKDGYEKLRFVLTITRENLKPTKKQIHNMVMSRYCANTGLISHNWYAILDYDTGYSLESDNDFGVKVKGTRKYKNKKMFKDNDGCRIWWRETTVFNISVTYPKDYKGLCIGVGGKKVLKKETKNDERFWEGKVVYGNTNYYKKDKANSHFMRVVA